MRNPSSIDQSTRCSRLCFRAGVMIGGCLVALTAGAQGAAENGLSTLSAFVNAQATARTLQPEVLHHFPGASDLIAPLALGNDGRLYGTTRGGGQNRLGTLFAITSSGEFAELAEFSESTGYRPAAAGLIFTENGDIYGTATQGGLFGYGTVFKLAPNGTLSALAHFEGENGRTPEGGLTMGPNGNFYGTTTASTDGRGTVFRVTPEGVLTTLAGFPEDYGSFPAGLTLASGRSDGSLHFYGTTYNGVSGAGTVFRVAIDGNPTKLASLSGCTKQYSTSLLQVAPGRRFYGATFEGGVHARGSVFFTDASGNVTELASFNGDNGSHPTGPLTLGADGNLYGTTVHGGAFEGTVFRMTPEGQLTTLADFTSRSSGVRPYGGVVFGANNSLYGTTITGGEHDGGTLFRVQLPPSILSQPESAIRWQGSTLSLSVTASGTDPIEYQWFKDGLSLANGDGVSGANSSTLTLSDVQPVDAGSYVVVVSNSAGAAISAAASVTVRMPPPGSTTLTFDDISRIADGYGGLAWEYFIISRNGSLTSPPNAALSRPATYLQPTAPPAISSPTLFDFNAGFFASFLETSLGATGYRGTNRVYQASYPIGPTPSLIEFNFSDVDRVIFSPRSFLMDDLNVTLTDEPALPLTVDVGDVVIDSIGHFVFDPNPPFPLPDGTSPRLITKVLIDQSQDPGAGGLLPSFEAKFGIQKQLQVRIEAPPGHHFRIRPSRYDSVRFAGNLTWHAPGETADDTLLPGEFEVTFEGLKGTAPDFAGSRVLLSSSGRLVGFQRIVSTPVGPGFAFTAMMFTATFPSGPDKPRTLFYGPTAGSMLVLYSPEPAFGDPGDFVSIVPLDAPEGATNETVAVRVPVLDGYGLDEGGFHLQLAGEGGRRYRIEASSDLEEWTAVTELTAEANGVVLDFTEREAPRMNRRFYRAVFLP